MFARPKTESLACSGGPLKTIAPLFSPLPFPLLYFSPPLPLHSPPFPLPSPLPSHNLPFIFPLLSPTPILPVPTSSLPSVVLPFLSLLIAFLSSPRTLPYLFPSSPYSPPSPTPPSVLPFLLLFSFPSKSHSLFRPSISPSLPPSLRP